MNSAFRPSESKFSLIETGLHEAGSNSKMVLLRPGARSRKTLQAEKTTFRSNPCLDAPAEYGKGRQIAALSISDCLVARSLQALKALQTLGAFVTFPERMHRVQAFTYLGLPSTIARTLWRFGSQRRFVRLCAWETLFPVIGPFPQISHRCAMISSSLEPGNRGPLIYHRHRHRTSLSPRNFPF